MDGPETPPDRRHVRAIAAVLALQRFRQELQRVADAMTPPGLRTGAHEPSPSSTDET